MDNRFNSSAISASGMEAQARRLRHVSECSAGAGRSGYRHKIGGVRAVTAGARRRVRVMSGLMRSLSLSAHGLWRAARGNLPDGASIRAAGRAAQVRSPQHVWAHGAIAGVPGPWRKIVVVRSKTSRTRSMAHYSDIGACAADGIRRACGRSRVIPGSARGVLRMAFGR